MRDIHVTMRVSDTSFFSFEKHWTIVYGLSQKRNAFLTLDSVTRLCILLATTHVCCHGLVPIDRRLYNVALSISFHTIQHFRTVDNITWSSAYSTSYLQRMALSSRNTYLTIAARPTDHFMWRKTRYDHEPLRNKSFVTTVVSSSYHRQSLRSIRLAAEASGLAMRRWCTPIRYHLHRQRGSNFLLDQVPNPPSR